MYILESLGCEKNNVYTSEFKVKQDLNLFSKEMYKCGYLSVFARTIVFIKLKY